MAPHVSTRRKLAFLRRADSYPEVTQAAVQVIETHFAWIFLTATHAYKMKKPQRHVWDYRYLHVREKGCRTEVRLNRRLAESVYVGVVPLSCTATGGLVLGRGERIVDWLVKMRRLPAAKALDVLLLNGNRITGGETQALVDLLARFYNSASRKPMSADGYVRSLSTRIARNRADLKVADLRINPLWIDQIVGAQRQFVRDNAALLGDRAGHVVECHGDLRPEHIFLAGPAGGPCAIDCLEFDAHLRRLDPAEELAFLKLECRRLGAHLLAEQICMGTLQARSDPVPPELIYFYMSCQALNRAKVSAWHLRDPKGPRRALHWRARTDSYLADADHFVRWALQSTARAAARIKSSECSAADAGPAC